MDPNNRREQRDDLPQVRIEAAPQINPDYFRLRGFGGNGRAPEVSPVIQVNIGGEETVMGYPVDGGPNQRRDI